VFGLSVDTVNSILVALMAVAPLFVMLSVLHGGFARTGELRELGVMLGAVAATSADLSRAVRSTASATLTGQTAGPPSVIACQARGIVSERRPHSPYRFSAFTLI